MRAANLFADRPALALRYEGESSATLVGRLRVACWLGIVLVPLFGALDAILYPHLVGSFLLIRLTIVTLLVATLGALRTATGRRRAPPLSLFTLCQTGLGIALMTAFTGGGSSHYYAGINLVMLAAAVLMPWEIGRSAACAMVLIGAYAGLSIAWAGVPDVTVFVGNLFFLCSTGVITVVSHEVAARARRREFLQRIALEEAGRYRDEFLANITHELRTPLAAILGFCDMLVDDMPGATAEQKGWLGRIHDNALTLYRLIVQLLDFSKIEAGAMHLDRERFTLDGIVTKVAADMRAIAGLGGVEIGVDVVPDSPPVIGDPARVEEIVTNLASNAVKFSAGRPIMLALRHVTIDHQPPWDRVIPEPGPDAGSATYAEVTVTDGGEGIRLEDLHRLFVAFQQLDGSSTRLRGGTGLGLALSARLAAAMHGHVAVRSQPGLGSTFALLLPAAVAEAARTDGTLDAAGGAVSAYAPPAVEATS